eukprot:CAMPEP_0179906490 /NCGR_PEP_ID=MMETSP0982-20121206/43274_1 /TAXON_ID=483367 /ORGANISM="non described non described, Strain CCMP 2436" /LENGTH=81 /DNA_ID=CAMNT_0021807005 /DNA_START=338 /DNA_END=579 /DNA_ORIENTATION=+
MTPRKAACSRTTDFLRADLRVDVGVYAPAPGVCAAVPRSAYVEPCPSKRDCKPNALPLRARSFERSAALGTSVIGPKPLPP